VDTVYIVHTSLCVCLSITAFPHYRRDLGVTWGVVSGASSCAPLGGFAIGAQVLLLWQHTHM